MRHTVPTTLLSDSQTDGDVSLEAVSATKPGSMHSLQGMAAVGGFGASPVGPSTSATGAPADASSRRSSLKQRRRSNNMVRAPIAAAEELSPTSPQGCTPAGSDGPDDHQLPTDSKSVNSRAASDVQLRVPQRDEVAPGTKTKTSHINTAADSEDDTPSENVAFSAAGQTKLPSHKPASKLGKTSTSFSPAVSAHTVDNSLPPSLPSLPGAVRRPDSFALAMSDQLLVASEPRRGRGARSPGLETQPEEELSGIFEFSV